MPPDGGRMRGKMSDGLWMAYEKVRCLYEKDYDIRLCRPEDIERLIAFIDHYWQKDHIFTKCRELLDWQHYDREHGRYNFVLAIHKKTNEIHGVIGFILSSIYDRHITTPIRWGVLWKVREDIGAKGLGMALKYYLEKHVPAPYVGGVGLSRFSKGINQKMEEEVGKLDLFYMLNSYMEHFQLAQLHSRILFEKPKGEAACHFREVSEEHFLEKDKSYFHFLPPHKSPRYYVGRYFRHPIYQYHFTEIPAKQHRPGACFVWRVCEHMGHRCIVIVDYMGKAQHLAGHYADFQRLLAAQQAEYISFFQKGLDEQFLCEAGFRKRLGDEIVIPVYYEPFLKQNVDLDYHYFAAPKATEGRFIFKGDADQDRPNCLSNQEK